MKSFLGSLLGVLVAFGVVFLIVIGLVTARAVDRPKIEKGSWLVVDLYGEITEYDPPTNILGELMSGKPETLQRILTNLDKARVDDRIEGVIFRLSASNGAGRAKLEEMRAAVKKVQAGGKKVYGFSDTMDRHTYYLAAACDGFFMPPTAYMNFIGMSITTEHIKGALDKLRIKANLHKIEDYKSAAEMLVNEEMSKPARRNREWLLDEYWELYGAALAEDRGIGEEQLIALMEKALITIPAAVELGLVDSMLYWDELEAYLAGGERRLETVSQATYAKITPASLGLKGKRNIAVVHAQGLIGGRKNRIDPLLGIMMGHETIGAQLRKAREDDNVAAVVLRVDSGGGESLASDLMGHEVAVTARVKPVVVSMVDVAASGGYMISYRATRLVAGENTLTGSIGSISAKFNVDGFNRMLGITHDYVSRGPNALLFSPYRDFTAQQWRIFTDNHWEGFNAWLRDVAEHRGMTFEEAEKLAHGRVWTGRQGAANGLVDATGGLDRAIEIAKELAQIPLDERVAIEHYPPRKTLLEAILSEGALATAAKYVVWRFIEDEVAESLNMLAGRRMHLMEETRIR